MTYSVIWADGGWDHARDEARDGGRCLGECEGLWAAARLARRWAESAPWPGGVVVVTGPSHHHVLTVRVPAATAIKRRLP